LLLLSSPLFTQEKEPDVREERGPEQEPIVTRHEVTVAMVGKYVNHADAYKSLVEALHHGGLRQRIRVNILAIESEDIEENGIACLAKADAILVPGGFGERGFEGKVMAIQYARENNVPYLGICFGMQAAEAFGGPYADADNDGVSNEISMGDLTVLSVFLSTLERPKQKNKNRHL